MSRTAAALLTLTIGLVLGAAVHILAIFGIPRLGSEDAYSRFATATEDGQAYVLDTAGAVPDLPFPDPSTAVSVCAFDLAKGPVRVRAPVREGFASLTIHARGGGVAYAVTDRAAVRGLIELSVLTQKQLDDVQAEEDEDAPVRGLRLVSPTEQGLVVVRILAMQPSQMPAARATVAQMTCGPLGDAAAP